MADPGGLDRAIDESRRAVGEVTRGNPQGFFDLYSDSEDATLANPFGPPGRGRTQIVEALERAASNYRDGRTTEFERVTKYVTPELAYTVEIERFEAKVGGSDEMTSVALRVTSIYRPEDGRWKLMHRHADPITSLRSAESVVQQ